MASGRGAFLTRRSSTDKELWSVRRENAGMSSEMEVGILQAEYLRFQGKADLPWVSRGLRQEAESVVDGQQVEIPVPHTSELWGRV